MIAGAISSSQGLWYVTRATGLVALVLLSAVTALGLLTSARARSRGWPAFAVADLHRRLSGVALAFLAVHIVTAVVDPFTSIGWPAVLVPFSGAYRRFWLGLGTVSFDLLLAVVVSSVVRRFISVRWWRRLHWLAYASWPVAVIHGLGTGTDPRFSWVRVLTGLCVATVVGAGAWRAIDALRQRRRAATVRPQSTEPVGAWR